MHLSSRWGSPVIHRSVAWAYPLTALGLGAVAGVAARGPHAGQWLLVFLVTGALIAAAAQQTIP